jgi:hypothetical protein
MPDFGYQIPDDGYRVSSIEALFWLHRPRRRPRPRPRNRKKFNGVEDEYEYEDDYEPKDKLIPPFGIYLLSSF